MSDYQGNIVIKNPATPTGPTAGGRAPGMWKLSDVAYWIKQGVWPDANIPAPDTFFPYVSLLLSTTSLGNANNNLFVDSSGAFNPVSRNGNTTQGSFTPYATNWSNYFDGSGDYLTVPDNSALDFGTGDFTIEMWINAQNLASTPMLFHKGTTSTGWFFQTSTTTLYFGQLDGGRYTTWTVSLADNGWYHIALTRVGAVLNVFVNGISQGAKTVTDANVSNDNAELLYIGRFSNGSYQYQGYISNYRVVKGTAVYTSNFTVPTSPLTAITNTSLLTCQSNRFRDASANNFTVTVFGNTSVQDFGPFSPAYPGMTGYNQSDITNWSGYLNGSSYWTVPTSNALDVWDNGSGSFTVEAWIYATASIGNNVSIVAKAPNNGLSSWSPGWAFQVFNGYLNVNTPSDTRLFNSNTTSVPLNQWVHCALVKSGSTVSIYQNGVRVGTTTNSTAYSNTTDAVAIGVDRNFAGSKLTGYVSNVRMVKGTAVYDPTQSTLTVPTTNLTAVSGTSLLTLQSAAFTDNSGNNYLINFSGTPTVTGNSPFNTVGYWSNYFDGTSDWLATPSDAAFGFGTGDFTIECWAYPTSTKSNMRLWQFGGDSDNVDISSGGSTGAISYYNGSTSTVSSSGVITFNAWNHVACVRSSGTVRIYVNGVLQVTQATTPNSSTRILYIAGQPNNWFEGYISNFRVVKGTAVYTSAFTPPTSPLTSISGTSLLTCQNGRFIDNSTNAFTITRNGDVSVQSFDPFYTATIASNGGSMYFDGSGDYLSVPNGQLPFSFGTSNFTIEAWVYLTSIPGVYAGITDCRTSGSFQSWGLGMLNSSGTMRVDLIYGPSRLTGSTTSIPANTWTHVAVSRSSGTLRIFVNGVVDSSTASYSSAMDSTTTLPLIGNMVDNYPMIGYMSDFRVTKGSALYTSSFTPPTAPVTPTPSTTMLVNGMNAGIYDATTINDMETVGNAQVSTVQSKFGGSSMYFDGSGDYLSIPNSDALNFGTGDMTIECWVYLNTTSGTQTIASKWIPTVSWIWQFTSTTMTFYFGASGSSFSWSPATSTWYHLAITRSSGSVRFFVNGVQTGSTVTNTTSASSTSPMAIGANNDGPQQYLNGYIDDFRITKGVARYTANFTPPTQAFPIY